MNFSTENKDLGNSVFHTGLPTEDTDSSSSEESDIEYELDSHSSDSDSDDRSAATALTSFQVCLLMSKSASFIFCVGSLVLTGPGLLYCTGAPGIINLYLHVGSVQAYLIDTVSLLI